MSDIDDGIPPSKSCWYAIAIAFIGVCIIPMLAYEILYRSQLEPPEWPIYSVDDVQKVCEWFTIDSNDVFCTSPENNDPNTFDAMLRRRFPKGVAMYDEVMNSVHVTSGKLSNDEISQIDDFPIGYCPPPQQRGEEYQCLVFLSPDYRIGPVTFYFDTSSNTVTGHVVARPSFS